jgi:hypothetical protein
LRYDAVARYIEAEDSLTDSHADADCSTYESHWGGRLLEQSVIVEGTGPVAVRGPSMVFSTDTYPSTGMLVGDTELPVPGSE